MHSQKAFYPTIPEHRNGLDKESGTYTIKIQGSNIKVKLRALIAGSSQGGALSSTLTLFTDTNPELLPASDMRKWTLLKTLHQSSISSNIESLIYVELDHILDLEEASEMSMTLKATCMTLYLYHLEIIPVDECN
ncbi:hypothetical protein K7432_007647 [Basidiobolus ranarum]|uniref:Uncharacterized protein n=1 Tax=Basidiobolus ranarum TaxID=34480 RepID=A0ABR2WT23_9FUNG